MGILIAIVNIRC